MTLIKNMIMFFYFKRQFSFYRFLHNLNQPSYNSVNFSLKSQHFPFLKTSFPLEQGWEIREIDGLEV